MAIGSVVRSLCGPYEQHISEAYRSIYVDLDALAECIQHWRRHATRILEIGCGEGAMTGRLARIYPDAEIVAIDITSQTGRLHHAAAKAALAENGAFVFKDWGRACSPIHDLCYALDRWITGDQNHCMTVSEIHEMMTEVFGQGAVVAEARINSWRNHVAYHVCA